MALNCIPLDRNCLNLEQCVYALTWDLLTLITQPNAYNSYNLQFIFCFLFTDIFSFCFCFVFVCLRETLDEKCPINFSNSSRFPFSNVGNCNKWTKRLCTKEKAGQVFFHLSRFVFQLTKFGVWSRFEALAVNCHISLKCITQTGLCPRTT